MALTIKKGDEVKPGYWGRPNDEEVSVCCPDCGKAGALTDHDIDKSGYVRPSLVCPNDDCDFHQFVKLEDWSADD